MLFAQQVQTVCQTYLDAPELYFQANTHTSSIDEMPGIQTTERVEKTIPIQPGQPSRTEYEYKRHGTLCLIGNRNVVTGAVLRGSFTSVQELKDRLIDFIDYYNKTFARPFRRAHTSRATKSQQPNRPRTWRESWVKKREAGQQLALA